MKNIQGNIFASEAVKTVCNTDFSYFSNSLNPNKKYAVLFPGQGSQFIGMGKELAQNFAVAKQTFEEVDF